MRMGYHSFHPILFILLHLVFVHLAQTEYRFEPDCPPSFNCGIHGPISFPFANSTYPKCGLATVSCHEHFPTIQLGGKWYDLEVEGSSLQSHTIKISDPVLQDHINNRSCDYFNNLSLPNSHSFATISPNLTFFKCAKSHEADYYFSWTYNSTQCPENDTFYSMYPYDHTNYGSPPPDCSVIHVRVLHRNADYLFALLAAELSLELNVSDACDVCSYRGGQCLNDQHEFHCVNAKEGRKHLKIILAAASSAAGIAALIILALCFSSKFSFGESMAFWKKRAENYRDIEAFLKNYGSLAPKRYSYLDVKKMTNSFKFKLGQGGYGCVYRGKLKNGGLVAVKVLNEPKGSGEEFINEVASISRTSHVNIVNLLGFCFEGSKRALIYEFLPNGSLKKFIYDRNSLTNRQLEWETLYQIAVGIARGLEYLHRDCNTQILHFDIKPHNILLDEDFCPKISDFGLAKLCPGKESVISMLGARGTAGYIAPEVFCRNIGGVSHKSDVYSYGMMVLEMVGGRKNIDVGADNTSEIYFPHWIHKRLVLDEEFGLHGIINDEQKESARKMIIVGLWCIQTNPSDRPPMSRVVGMLEGSLETMQIPPAPVLSSPLRSPSDSSTTPAP